MSKKFIIPQIIYYSKYSLYSHKYINNLKVIEKIKKNMHSSHENMLHFVWATSVNLGIHGEGLILESFLHGYWDLTV